MSIKLEAQAREVLVADALTTYPHECCGFLYGQEEGNERVFTEAVEVNNTRDENRERRFEISALDYMKAEQYADENGLTLLGVYHSHPDHPAIPSEYDLRHALPYFSYIIASIRRGKLSSIYSWRLDDKGKFEQEDLEILEPQELDLNELFN